MVIKSPAVPATAPTMALSAALWWPKAVEARVHEPANATAAATSTMSARRSENGDELTQRGTAARPFSFHGRPTPTSVRPLRGS